MEYSAYVPSVEAWKDHFADGKRVRKNKKFHVLKSEPQSGKGEVEVISPEQSTVSRVKSQLKRARSPGANGLDGPMLARRRKKAPVKKKGAAKKKIPIKKVRKGSLNQSTGRGHSVKKTNPADLDFFSSL